MHGVGLRTAHFPEWLTTRVCVDLVEAISENFAGRGGRPLAVLEHVRRDHQVALHGVSLSIGGCDPIDEAMLDQIKALADRIDAAWVGDHLCFSTVGGHAGHDLWPLPLTEEAIAHVVPRIAHVQERLGRRLVLENISTYVQFRGAELTEPELLTEVARRADCELLLDLNNVHVSAFNHHFDAYAFIAALPTERIRQLHLAGHTDLGDHLFDSHAAPVAESVWDLFAACVAHHGAKPTIVEWDAELPPLDRVIVESERARAIEARVLEAR